MARRPDPVKRQKRLEAYRLDQAGFTSAEIGDELGVAASTVRGWLTQIRGPRAKKSMKAQIQQLARDGYSPVEIQARTGAHSSTIYRALGRFRGEPRDRAVEWLDTEPPDYEVPHGLEKRFRKELLIESAVRVDMVARSGLVSAARVETLFDRHYQRARSQKRARLCDLITIRAVIAAGHRMAGDLTRSDRLIQGSRQHCCGCPMCVAELDRVDGWLSIHRMVGALSGHQAALAMEERRRGVELFGRSLSAHRRFLAEGHAGHAIHGDGVSNALASRATINLYAGDAQMGLVDARTALDRLNRKASSGLVLFVTSAYAQCLLRVGGKENLAEAQLKLEEIHQWLTARHQEDTAPFARFLWARGLVCQATGEIDAAEGSCLDSYDIFSMIEYAREAISVLLDILDLHGRTGGIRSQRRFLERVFSRSGRTFKVPPWMEHEFERTGFAALWAAIKSEARDIGRRIEEVRAASGGDDLMPRPACLLTG